MLVKSGRIIRSQVWRIVAVGAALGLQFGAARGQEWLRSEHAGAVYTLTRDVESSQEDTAGSTGSSTDRDTLQERIIAVRKNGLELEYDEEKSATADDRARNWQLPVRVFKPIDGPLQLLNEAELEGRLTTWLQKAKLTRAACGRYFFTWTAFRVECDPKSVLSMLASYDLRPNDLSDGGVYVDPQASSPASLTKTTSRSSAVAFTGKTPVSPDQVRKNRAEGDVAAAQILQRKLTFDDALRARMAEKVSGTIRITFETSPNGLVRKRNRIVELEIRTSNGIVERQMTREVVERKPEPAR